MAKKHDCETCRLTWALYGEDPKCEECMPVDLNQEHVKAFQVYQICQGQMITRGVDGTPIDISIPAVEITMKWLGVPENQRGRCGQKVMALARHDFVKMRDARNPQGE